MVSRRQLLTQLGGVSTIILAGCTAPKQDGQRTEPHKVPTPPEETNFDLKVRVYEKYDIGTCFGMPGGVSEEMMEEEISTNSSLVTKLQEEYDVSETEQLYEMIQQYNQISVTETEDGTIEYEVKDGECCKIYTYSGVITDSEVREKYESVEGVPC